MATALAGAGNGPCERIVCLGLGHVWTKAGTRQLALLETLRADATVAKPGALVIAADPAFDERDKAVLAALRIDVPPTMELADKAHATNGQRTLYFMPHCPAVLYNNVLWANWSQKALCDALIVGNRLVSYLDDGRELPEDCECLRKLAHRARVLAPQLGKALEVNSLFELAFCDMLPHAFFSEDLDLKLFDDIPAPARFD
ncbi:SRR1-like protein [Hondaea fermentalgiana]|uniref:SRR1-like protein n=1 Tax=Hondaea fermentalgiana TaxID=2315210 RepID=A0A2R5GM17_9STRA|nr:SRR1-like protein [Hondaea fermentalgiana]|eukprot:GBG31936.1 SRR1-like protein [Hondaea fermentalgiana]